MNFRPLFIRVELLPMRRIGDTLDDQGHECGVLLRRRARAKPELLPSILGPRLPWWQVQVDDPQVHLGSHPRKTLCLLIFFSSAHLLDLVPSAPQPSQ